MGVNEGLVPPGETRKEIVSQGGGGGIAGGISADAFLAEVERDRAQWVGSAGASERAGGPPPPGAPFPCLFVTSQTKSEINRAALARKAHTLFLNLEDLMKRVGIERIGFLTCTFVENLTDRREAQRRFNSLATGFLRKNVEEWIVTVERQQRGALHDHLVVAFPFDIRSGFDFDACRAANRAKRRGDMAEFHRLEKIYFASANDNLWTWWRLVREKAPAYGFGRCETLPILSNSQALAKYVGSYVTKDGLNRLPCDKGLRTVRYSLKHRLASQNWRWIDGASAIWRKGCSILGAIYGTDDLALPLGKHWAWETRQIIWLLGRNYERALAYTYYVPEKLPRWRCYDAVMTIAEALWKYEESSFMVNPSGE